MQKILDKLVLVWSENKHYQNQCHVSLASEKNIVLSRPNNSAVLVRNMDTESRQRKKNSSFRNMVLLQNVEDSMTRPCHKRHGSRKGRRGGSSIAARHQKKKNKVTVHCS